MEKILTFLSSRNWIYRLVVKLIAYKIIRVSNNLTPEYLKNKGWVKENDFWVEPKIKTRDKIWIEFENHYYRVYYGPETTFISLESTIDWFEIFYLIHNSKKLYDLADI